MLFRLRLWYVKLCGYRLVRVIHHESYRDQPLTEGVYRHPTGREKHLVVGKWLAKAQME